ncbi:hypothetical protein ACROYT_G003606 [Oculina patagonica]
MKLSLVIVVVVGLIQCQEGESKCFAQVCFGNPTNQIRGCDNYGCGYYGAPREGGTHWGIDIVCTAGLWVRSPIPAEVVREAKPYAFGHDNYNKPFNTGVLLEGTGDWDVQCSAVRCGAVRCGAVQCSAVQCSAVQCSAVQCSAVQCSAVRCSAVQCSAVQCSAVQCSVVWCGVVKCSEV